jgi:hypothetical protein
LDEERVPGYKTGRQDPSILLSPATLAGAAAMFCSLNQIDLVTKGKGGRKLCIQTDHRTPAEIEEEPELSILFAVVRVLAPSRILTKGSAEPIVIYDAQHQPPEFLCQAIRAAGARLQVGGAAADEEGAAPSLEEILASTFASLARRVAVKYDVALTTDGLDALEPVLVEEAGSVKEDEIVYWSAVMRLGAFGGEVIRASNGGHWQVIERGTIPLALSTTFQGSPATVNPLGKAMKRFDIGEEDSVSSLVHFVSGRS